MIDKKHITGIILSGGKSARIGTDKGFLSLNGKLFTQHSIDVLKPLVSEIIIVSNHSKYDVFGLQRVEDIIENAGPVAGVYSGLEASKTEYNLVLSCDIPLMTSHLLKKLIEAIDGTSEVIQIESDGQSMPLIALYKKQCKSTFLKLLNGGERRLRIVVAACKVKNIILEKEDAIVTMNVNTQNELKVIKNANNR